MPAIVTIGFLNTIYSVNESEGIVSLEIGVLEGLLQRETVISLSTYDLSAVGNAYTYTLASFTR